jgi:hypothetical protein
MGLERGFKMSFKTVLKTKQNRLLSKTWRITLVAKEIQKNNYHVTGNLQQARDFAYKAARYEIPQSILDEFTNEPIVIFSNDYATRI